MTNAYDRTNSRLIDEQTGRPINVGDVRYTFRGERCVVAGWRAPTHAGSSGRVYCTLFDGTAAEQEWFPGVIGARVVSASAQ